VRTLDVQDDAKKITVTCGALTRKQ